MTYWTNGYESFEDEMDARNNVCTEISWDDYENYFQSKMDFYEFFTRVRNMPNFSKSSRTKFVKQKMIFFSRIIGKLSMRWVKQV